jgi:hypothetical protein
LVETEIEATVTADVSQVDTTQPKPIALIESSTIKGVYSATVVINSGNTAKTGDKTITIIVTDPAGNVSESKVNIKLWQETSFTLNLHAGVNLLHLPKASLI